MTRGAPLAGQVAIVTGGASGIGRATTRLLAEQGAGVCVLDRDDLGGQQVVGELGDEGASASFVQIDLADPTAIAPAVSACAHRS